MKFSMCAQVFQQLQMEPSRTEKTKLLAGLLQKCTPQEAKIVAYMTMESLFPAYKDKQFNIATKGMVAILATLCDRSSQDIEQKMKVAGDLGLVVQDLWHGADTGLTIQQVYEQLVEIAHIVGTKSTEIKAQKLVELLKQLDTMSAKFVVRLVTKSMRLGFSDMTFLDALSWMHTGSKQLSKKIEHAYNVCADLGLVAQTLKSSGLEGIESMHIQVGIPIRPAAAERLSSPQAIVEKLGPCVAQPKLDGFRVQVHLKKEDSHSEVNFFSRNMLDMSDMFPDLKKIVEQLPVTSLICEGEAIVYDEDTETFLSFQETVKRKRKHDIDQLSQELPLRLYIFDILYLNGMSLLDHTHKQRRDSLLSIVHNANNPALQVIGQEHITTAKQLDDYFLRTIGAGLEGLVVKREDGVYQPGKRNFNWIKLKRESHGSLLDTIDGVILGYYVGRGKRARFGIGAFLLGIYDTEQDQFVTVAKVGTGLTDDALKDLKQRCDAIKVAQKPVNVVCAKELYPDVWMAPKIVCEVKSEEITLSPMHTAGKKHDTPGYGLRFPRFVQYRFDKSVYDATTTSELLRLYHEQKA